MTIDDLPQEDKDQVKQILLAERAAGNESPMLPMNVDLDGDGTADSFGLDDNDELVLVPGVPLEETVYHSEGDDITDATPDSNDAEGGE